MNEKITLRVVVDADRRELTKMLSEMATGNTDYHPVIENDLTSMYVESIEEM